MKMNLREAFHMCELRTMPQVIRTVTSICQEMRRKIQEVHPALANAGTFIDWQMYRLVRLESAMRTKFKNLTFEQLE